MSVQRVRMPDARRIPIELANFVSSDRFTERIRQPAGAPPTKRRQAVRNRRGHDKRAAAGAGPAKYLVVAALGVLMATLLACGASTEPADGESSSNVAPAPTTTDSQANAPAATKSSGTAPSATTDTTAPTTMPETAPAPTDVPAQAVPADTPATDTPAATPTQQPPTPTPEPEVEILTPGVTVGQEVWWARDSHLGDHTLPAVRAHHKSLENIHQEGGANAEKVATMMAEQAIAVLQASGTPPADVEAIKNGLSEHLPLLSWEILNSKEPLVRYWTTLHGNERYNVGAVIRYNPAGQVEGFADPPTDELELEGVWWYKERSEYPIGDYTTDALLALHPQAVHLDTLDRIKNLPDSSIDENSYGSFADIFRDKMAHALAHETSEVLQTADPEYTRDFPVSQIEGDLHSHLDGALSWELISPNADHLRVWARFYWRNGVGGEYWFRVGGLAVMVPMAASEWEYSWLAELHELESVLVFSHFDGPVVLERVE